MVKLRTSAMDLGENAAESGDAERKWKKGKALPRAQAIENLRFF